MTLNSGMQQRDYQTKAIEDCRRAFRNGARRIILQAPTGAGKTVIGAQIVEGAVQKGNRVLFLAHRRELVHQCADKLRRFGVDYGILMAGEDPMYEFEVQVASIDTLRVRCLESGKFPLPRADVVMIDECHRSLAPTYLRLIKHYVDEYNAVVMGLSATPIRGDGRGLGHVYEHMVCCPSINELTRMGHLVQVEYYAPTIPDLTGIKITRGDYDEKELDRAMNQRKAVGDIVTNWARIGRDRPTIVFATSVAHSIHLCEEFRRAGVAAEHIDGGTMIAERETILRNLHTGRTQVVTNCMVLTEGFDEPKLSCCVLARPTKNEGLYLQMAGRTLRPAEGKVSTRLIDHSGNVYEHGFLADERRWSLDEGKPLTSSPREPVLKEGKSICCIQCSLIYTGQRRCPGCGHLPERRGEYVDSRHADLMRIDEEKRRTAKRREYTMEDKQRWYSMLLHYAHDKKRKAGWVAHTYRDKFGVWPRGMEEIPIAPNLEVTGYIRHKNIRFAHRQRKLQERGHHATVNEGSSQG